MTIVISTINEFVLCCYAEVTGGIVMIIFCICL